MADAHQSTGSSDCTSCRKAALVKKIEPTKKVIPTTDAATSEAYPGTDPSAKQKDPIMKRTPVHHGGLPGRHPTRVSARHAGRGSTAPTQPSRSSPSSELTICATPRRPHHRERLSDLQPDDRTITS